MIVIACYLVLNMLEPAGWSGWLMVLPVLTDLAMVNLIMRGHEK